MYPDMDTEMDSEAPEYLVNTTTASNATSDEEPDAGSVVESTAVSLKAIVEPLLEIANPQRIRLKYRRVATVENGCCSSCKTKVNEYV